MRSPHLFHNHNSMIKTRFLPRTAAVVLLATAWFPSGAFAAGFSESANATATDNELDDPLVLYSLGQKHLKGDGVPRDNVKAFTLLQKAANLQHAEAMAAVGYLYSVGLGVQQDDGQARACFAMAEENGSVAGRVNLGLFLIRGRGGDKDVEKGVALLRKAAEGGNKPAAVRLGEIFFFGEHADGRPDYRKAHDVLIAAAEAGDPAAQNMVGVILLRGYLGDKDEVSARIWLEKAALQGHAKACANLADCWNFRSTERAARIEAIRWLIVAKNLQETTATATLQDVRASLAPDELLAAQELAETTLENISKAK